MAHVGFRLLLGLLLLWEYGKVTSVLTRLSCLGAPRCGAGNLSIVMHYYDETTLECSNVCIFVLFFNHGLECGSCSPRNDNPMLPPPTVVSTATPTTSPVKELLPSAPPTLVAMDTAPPSVSLTAAPTTAAVTTEPTLVVLDPEPPRPRALPTLGPTMPPSREPIVAARPSFGPTTSPTSVPPTVEPTLSPTMRPTPSPSSAPAPPTMSPSSAPAKNPSATPIVSPPTPSPTGRPTTLTPTSAPVVPPTPFPTGIPTKGPTSSPIVPPTRSPTRSPTDVPTSSPIVPPTSSPTGSPTNIPTSGPIVPPTPSPTGSPTNVPTSGPIVPPTPSPTRSPTNVPTSGPIVPPTPSPTGSPTNNPTSGPIEPSTPSPTRGPSKAPTSAPTVPPTSSPTRSPSKAPTSAPTVPPTSSPTRRPAEVATPAPTVSSTQAPTPSFRISFTFIGVPVDSQATIQAAADMWETVVVGDLPDEEGTGLTSLFPFGTPCTYPDVIDDLHLCVGYFDGFPGDGPGGVLGVGGAERLRTTSNVPFTGIIALDPNDPVEFNTMLHEMGHALGTSIFTIVSYANGFSGIGVLWEVTGVTSSFDDGCVYKGSFANQAYLALSGCETVPVLSSNMVCAHFDDACLGDELMTARLPVSTQTAPLSTVTIGAIKDLGYEVDTSSAQTLSLDGLSCPCSRRVRSRDLLRQQGLLSQNDHMAAYKAGLSLLPGPGSPKRALAVLYRGNDGNLETVVVLNK